MTTNKPEVVTMGDRYPESECYQCGRLKTALSYRSRCLTCETQRADANADENDELRTRLSDYEALQTECETLRKDAERYQWLCEKLGVTTLPCAIERIQGGKVYVADGKASIDAAIDAAMREGDK